MCLFSPTRISQGNVCRVWRYPSPTPPPAWASPSGWICPPPCMMFSSSSVSAFSCIRYQLWLPLSQVVSHQRNYGWEGLVRSLLFPVILEVMSEISQIDLATSREDDGYRGGYLNLVTWVISWQLGGRGSWRGKAGGGGCREAEKQWRKSMWWVVWEDCCDRSTSSTLSIQFRRMKGLFFNCQHKYLGQLGYIDIA